MPVIRLIIGGEFDVLENAAYSTQSAIPIVICIGTGGAADILGKASIFWNSKKQ